MYIYVYAKWQILVPNCCTYKANGTRKESQTTSKTWAKKQTKNYSEAFNIWWWNITYFTIHLHTHLATYWASNRTIAGKYRWLSRRCGATVQQRVAARCSTDAGQEKALFVAVEYCGIVPWEIDWNPELWDTLSTFLSWNRRTRNHSPRESFCKFSEVRSSEICWESARKTWSNGCRWIVGYHNDWEHSTDRIHTLWAPPVISWFINPMNTIVIGIINHIVKWEL